MASTIPPSVFTDSQLLSFLQYIEFPPELHSYRYFPSNDPTKDLEFLTQLHIYTISAVPYENLSLHYNSHHNNSIAPLDVFKKVVENKRGRGGYCMELSIFFNHILRALGFQAYTSMVRIRYRGTDGVPAGDYIGWYGSAPSLSLDHNPLTKIHSTHIVNLVTLADGSKHHIDVAFGGDGATSPMPLTHNTPQTNLGTQEIRLYRDWIPTQTLRNEETKLWIYQYRNNSHQDWNSFYAFSEQEAVEPDFEILNFWTSGPSSFQSTAQLIVKFLRRAKKPVEGGEGLADAGLQEIYGKRMLSGAIVKENLGGKTKVVEVCESEEQRVRALEQWFGISLTESERAGIRGWQTEISPDGQPV